MLKKHAWRKRRYLKSPDSNGVGDTGSREKFLRRMYAKVARSKERHSHLLKFNKVPQQRLKSRTQRFKRHTLKSNKRRFAVEDGNHLNFMWRTTTKGLKSIKYLSMQPIFNSTVLESRLTNSDYPQLYIQDFLSGYGVYSCTSQSQILTLIYNWMYYEHSLFSHVVELNKQLYSNDRIAFLTNIFNINRRDTHLWDRGLVIGGAVRNLPVSTTFMGRWSPTFRRVEHIPTLIFTDHLKVNRQSLNQAFLMLSRYVPFVSLSKQFLMSNRKIFYLYFLQRRDLVSRSLIRVNNSYHYFLRNTFLTRFKRRILNPNRGLANMLHSTLNDNLVEVSSDNTVSISAYNRMTNSTLKLIGVLRASTIARSCAGNLHYQDPYTPTRTFSKLTDSNRVSAYITGTPHLVLSSAALNRHLYNNPLLFKYFLWNQNNLQSEVQHILTKSLLNANISDLNKFHFSTRINLYQNSNVWPSHMFSYAVKRRVLKLVTYYKFLPNVTMWYHNTLVRFMEHCSGRKVYLKFNPFIENSLTYSDLARCALWYTRVYGFQRILGHRIFVQESIRILHLAFRFKDPTFLSNWIKGMLYRMSFWKYRRLFRYIKYVMRYLFFDCFPELDFKGLKLKLKGKISVAGNARARTLVYTIGETGHARVNNRVLSEFTTIHSFTGVMGFRVSFYY